MNSVGWMKCAGCGVNLIKAVDKPSYKIDELHELKLGTLDEFIKSYALQEFDLKIKYYCDTCSQIKDIIE